MLREGLEQLAHEAGRMDQGKDALAAVGADAGHLEHAADERGAGALAFARGEQCFATRQHPSPPGACELIALLLA